MAVVPTDPDLYSGFFLYQSLKSHKKKRALHQENLKITELMENTLQILM